MFGPGSSGVQWHLHGYGDKDINRHHPRLHHGKRYVDLGAMIMKHRNDGLRNSHRQRPVVVNRHVDTVLHVDSLRHFDDFSGDFYDVVDVLNFNLRYVLNHFARDIHEFLPGHVLHDLLNLGKLNLLDDIFNLRHLHDLFRVDVLFSRHALLYFHDFLSWHGPNYFLGDWNLHISDFVLWFVIVLSHTCNYNILEIFSWGVTHTR